MRDSISTHLDKPCDTCGGAKNKELMACCSQCFRAREHIYCMRVLLPGVPDKWCCDQCLLSKNESSLEGGAKEDSSRFPSFKRNFSNDTSKVKLISPEEAIRLSSGAMKIVPPRRSFLISKPGPSSDMALMFSTPVSGTPKLSPPKVIANPSFNPSGCPKPPQKGGEQVRPVTGTSITNPEMASCRDVPHAVPEFKSSSIEGKGPLSFIPYLFLPYCPAQDVTWKGGFRIHNGVFYDGFWGHPPFKVHRKAYKFSKTMPPVLEVKLVPRCLVWANLFHDDNPDLRDIGLYLLPGDMERSQDNHACLFELMEIQDVAMETCINGVELLVFTSTKLHVNSEMSCLIDGTTSPNNRFLWGVFRRAREDQTVNEEPTDNSSLVPPAGSVHANDTSMSNDDVVDMEIDMIGGDIVGSLDVPVSRESSRRRGHEILKGDDVKPRKVKSEFGVEHMDIPPGFEKISRQNSRTFLQKASSVKKEKLDV